MLQPSVQGKLKQDRNGVLSTYLMLYKACSFPRNSSQIFPTVVIILCGGFNIAFGHFLLIHHDFNLASWVSTRHLLGSWTSVKPEELQVAMNFFSEDSTLQCTSQPSHSPAINALENSADNSGVSLLPMQFSQGRKEKTEKNRVRKRERDEKLDLMP